MERDVDYMEEREINRKVEFSQLSFLFIRKFYISKQT